MKEDFKKSIPFIGSIVISIVALLGFLVQTEIFLHPLVPVVVSLFLLFPFRQRSEFARRLILLISLLFLLWILSDLGFAIFPFIVSFFLAYMLDPVVKRMTGRYMPRWLASLIIILLFVGIVTSVAIFVFPAIFSQLNDAINRISLLVSNLSKDLSEQSFFDFLTGIGIPEDSIRSAINEELIPKLEDIFTAILKALLQLINRLSSVATQLINAILIPILSFYFLKDFNKIEELTKSILKERSPVIYHNIQRISRILKLYISWQIIAAIIVGTSCSILFSIFGIPYPVVLGILCGFLNPIPYLGIFASMIICLLTIIMVNPPNIAAQMITVIIVISALHFINAYFLEPNIAGKQVGLHPVILIASLFVFGGLFGFIGLLIAVPSTAILMMFFNDWRIAREESDQVRTE